MIAIKPDLVHADGRVHRSHGHSDAACERGSDGRGIRRDSDRRRDGIAEDASSAFERASPSRRPSWKQFGRSAQSTASSFPPSKRSPFPTDMVAGVLPLYTGAGPRFTQWGLDTATLRLVEISSLTLPANVQYAWHAPRSGVWYVVTSDGGGRSGPPGALHHLTAVVTRNGSLQVKGQPRLLPSRPIHVSVDPGRESRSRRVQPTPSGARLSGRRRGHNRRTLSPSRPESTWETTPIRSSSPQTALPRSSPRSDATPHGTPPRSPAVSPYLISSRAE